MAILNKFVFVYEYGMIDDHVLAGRPYSRGTINTIKEWTTSSLRPIQFGMHADSWESTKVA